MTTANTIPAHSWVIRERSTGRVIAETWNAATVAALNVARYEAIPIGEHLAQLNRQLADAWRAKKAKP
jgi:hypothetical protein